MSRVLLVVLACAVAACASAPASEDPAELHAKNRVAPEYPASAARKAQEGCVVVAFDVRPDGKLDNYRILDSQPKAVFDRATLTAMNQWRAEPVSYNHRYAQQMDFTLKPSGLPPEHRCIELPSFAELNAAHKGGGP